MVKKAREVRGRAKNRTATQLIQTSAQGQGQVPPQKRKSRSRLRIEAILIRPAWGKTSSEVLGQISWVGTFIYKSRHEFLAYFVNVIKSRRSVFEN